ncbi:tetratricopeptide repeat protein [Stappia indica]|uniref:tetratricopeptide repeat protein n=1 Tax=Stappia indica TaxID=538381 RepID=UPI001CD576C8|nr:tetratricopeptide repeat protein [Stappia indica]MCA1298511.1 hypothetical protein [Stappia indica]
MSAVRGRSNLCLVSGLALLVVCGAVSAPACAEADLPGTTGLEVENPALLARQAELLAAMLRDPANLDIAFEYAALSARIGDLEAAVGTLERMLVFAPDQPRIRLELGALYFRLGSFDMARTHFEAVSQTPSVPEEVAARAATFLTEIDGQEAPATLSATLMTGVRYQTNANAGPGGRVVVLNGLPYLLDNTSSGKPDWNVFVAGNVHGAYDLGNQGDLLEADLLFYGGRYLDITRLNTELAELTVGPSFNLARFDIDDARLGVYGIIGGVRLNEGNYSGALGAGTRFAILPSSLSSVTGRVEFRRRWFRDTLTYPTISNRDGYQLLAQITHTRQVTENWAVRGKLLGDFEEASANFEQSWELGVALGATYSFASPIERLDLPWLLDADAGYIRREFAAPNPSVSLTESEYDNEFWLRGAVTVPLRFDVALALSAEFRRMQSNYQIKDFSNFSTALSVIKTF